MVRYQYAWPRKHVVSLRGVDVEFKSYHFEGSFSLWGEAVQALKDAGVYKEMGDAKKMYIDGQPAYWA